VAKSQSKAFDPEWSNLSAEDIAEQKRRAQDFADKVDRVARAYAEVRRLRRKLREEES
jgi:hypothetical protein